MCIFIKVMVMFKYSFIDFVLWRILIVCSLDVLVFFIGFFLVVYYVIGIKVIVFSKLNIF